MTYADNKADADTENREKKIKKSNKRIFGKRGETKKYFFICHFY